MDKSNYELTETRYGFRWGPLTVERLVSDAKLGLVLAVSGKAQTVEVRVSPTGRNLSTRLVERGPLEP